MPARLPLLTLAALGLPAVLVAALGAHNPVDALVRGKWVRLLDTGKGEATATLCIPAATPEATADHVADLPDRVRALHEAGAAVVAVDLDLRNHAHTLPALVEAARAGKTVLATAGGRVLSPEVPAGDPAMASTPAVPLVLGVAAVQGEVPPLALQALALHEGHTVVRDADGAYRVGERVTYPDEGSLNFMPYEVPFLHWTDKRTWTAAEGRIVVIGACRADRELTRFGRQPGSVAHSELIETLRDGRHVGQIPRVSDVGYTALVFAAAALARRHAGRLPALGVGLLAGVAALAISLSGLWMGLSGPLLAGFAATVWRPPRG